MPASPITFAQLPTSPKVKDSYDITDSVTATPGAIEVGGGRYLCTVYHNGKNWIDNPSSSPVTPGVPPLIQPPVAYTVATLPTYPQIILSDSPAAYWRLSEASGNFSDSTANANTAVAVGVSLYNQPGSVIDDPGGCVTNTVATAKATAATAASLNFGDVFTVEFAFKRSGTLGTSQFILQQVGAGGMMISFNTANQLTGFVIGGAFWFISTATFTDTNWHLCQITKNGSVYGLYVDGNPVPFTVPSPQTVGPPAYSIILFSNNGANGFIGSLDEIAMYPTALTAARCQAHYSEWVTRKNGIIAYATDGTPASNPVTGGGSGVTVTYYQGKWAAVL